jgi:hypothetical protein
LLGIGRGREVEEGGSSRVDRRRGPVWAREAKDRGSKCERAKRSWARA